jgi:acyl carrier protein
MNDSRESDLMQRRNVLETLTAFIEQEVLKSDHAGLEPTTPLLEWGILNSLSTVQLMAFIHDRYGLFVPADRITSKNFKNLDAVTDLVLSLLDDDRAWI